MDKFKAMQVVVAIADSGSMTAAAEALNSSLPAVVRTLALLEGQLGVRLFNRTTRRISLTEEGRTYTEDCRRLLAAIEESEAALTQDVIVPTGQLNVTAPVLFGQMYVAPAVTRFVQQHDRVRVNLQLHDRIVNLLEENMDVGVRIGELEDQSLIAQTLGHVRRMVVASPEYLRRHGTPKHPRELLGHNCIRYTGSSASGWHFREKGKTVAMPVTGNLEFNQIWPAVQACVSGLGCGMFISYQVADLIRAGKLQEVLVEYETPPRPVSIVYPHARLLPARTRVFIDWMLHELRFVEA